MKKLLIATLFLSLGTTGFSTIWTVIDASFMFSPDTLIITSGDSVLFQLGPTHTGTEVSQATWNANGNTPNGGFNTPLGGGLVLPAQLTPGTHWYVCTNHNLSGMKGVITVMPPPVSVFINEIHYDNTGTDANEGVEIAGPAGTNLACYQLLLYNGFDSLQDPSIQLSGIIPDQACGYGTLWFPVPGLQNGPADAVGLYDTCLALVTQFLSYEGQMTALDGPALGMTSVDIGISEVNSPVGQTLQLIGTGTVYSDFTWTGPLAGSEGLINNGQNFCINNSVLNFVSSSISVQENIGVLSVEVAIVNPSLVDTVAVDVVYLSGTATPGSDFTYITQTLLFPPSSTASQFAGLTVIDDTLLLESPETVILKLQNPTNGGILLADTLDTITIFDNDINTGPCSNLFFSEYLEGSSSNKALEIFNPSYDSIDLSFYYVKSFNNGDTLPTNSLNLSGILAPGDVYVITNGSATNANLIAASNITSSVANFNGNDAVALYQNLQLLDIIGEIGVDPVTGWMVGSGSTFDNTLVRRDTIHAGETNWAIGATQWDVYPIDDSAYIGYHTMIPCPLICSLILNIDSLVIDSSACGLNNGNISGITVSGGTTPFTYQWVNGFSAVVGNALDLLGVSSGSYTLTVIDSNGCSATSAAYAIFNAGAPPAPSATSPPTYCTGDTIASLPATGTGGMLYWYADAGLTVLLDSGNTFTSGATSTDTFYVAEMGTCLGPATQVIIIFDPTPVGGTASASPNPICSGSSTVITLAGNTGIIQWQSSPDNITFTNIGGATASSYVTPALTSAAYYRAVVTSGICPSANSASATVTVNTAPTANAGLDASICAGSSLQLAGSIGGGATSSTWTTSGTGTFNDATLLTAIYTPSAADITMGSVTLTLTTDVPVGPCNSASDNMALTIAPLPVANFSSSATNLTVAFTDISIGTIATWSWNFGDGTPLSSAQDPSHTYLSYGSYQVCLTVTSDMSCTSTGFCDSISVIFVGISEVDLRSYVDIFPVPSIDGMVTINFSNGEINGGMKGFEVSVYNVIGERVAKVRIDNKLIHRLDLSGLYPGLYTILINTASGVIVKKLILQ